MKNVVSFSGGRTSAYLCHLMKEKYGDDVDFVFMDTGAEDEATYSFLRRCNKYFDLDLTCIRVEFNPSLGKGNTYKVININDCKQDLKPWIGMLEKYSTPTVSSPFCTDRMKTTPFKKYCDDTYGKGNYMTWLGMRIDEPKRLKGLENDQIDAFAEPVKRPNIRYLAEVSSFEKQDILDWWAQMPFDLDIEEHLGNCVFCIKKSSSKIALAMRDRPSQTDRFKNILISDSVRDISTLSNRYTPLHEMYRGNNTLNDIEEAYRDFSREEIMQTIRSMKKFDTGTCSESCEAFGGENYDLFKEEI